MRSKKVIYNILTNLVLQLITIVYGFIVPKIIIDSFGSNVNGLVASITQFLAYISLLESGFGPVVKSILYKPIANKDSETIEKILKTSEKFFRNIAMIFLIYIIALCLIYPLLVSSNFSWFYTASLIAIIGISTFAEYFFGMTYRLYLQAKQKTYIISIIQIMTYILSVLLIVVLAKAGSSIHIIKLVSVAVFILRPILQNIYVKKKYNLNYSSSTEKYEIKQKWDGLAQHIAAVVHGNTDITILTIFVNLTEVSVYSVYYLVVNGIKHIIQSFTGGIDSIFGDMIAKNEISNLNKKFSMYEVLYNTISVILFTSTIILITPFVIVYTKNITDANYVRYAFGYLIIISEYIWAIRLPYSSITLAAGHFKETKNGAWVECLVNILVSVILVKKYGLIGVAIGTIIAMTIRTIEFVYHTNKYILNRSVWNSIKKIFIVIIETIIIVFIANYLPLIENSSFINWIINALIVGATSTIIVLIINYILYKREFRLLLNTIKGVLNRK